MITGLKFVREQWFNVLGDRDARKETLLLFALLHHWLCMRPPVSMTRIATSSFSRPRIVSLYSFVFFASAT